MTVRILKKQDRTAWLIANPSRSKNCCSRPTRSQPNSDSKLSPSISTSETTSAAYSRSHSTAPPWFQKRRETTRCTITQRSKLTATSSRLFLVKVTLDNAKTFLYYLLSPYYELTMLFALYFSRTRRFLMMVFSVFITSGNSLSHSDSPPTMFFTCS